MSRSSTRLYFDIETYPNYFLALFTNEQGKSLAFEIDDTHSLDIKKCIKLITNERVELVSFNGDSYDLPMLHAALSGFDNKELKGLSDRIIEMGLLPWQVYKMIGVQPLGIDHIDLINVAPGKSSLKLYAGRLNSPNLQDLPFSPDTYISDEQVATIRRYCKNDTLETQRLYRALEDAITLRREMSTMYGLDLRSKSDAQIAEAVLVSEYENRTGSPVTKTLAKKGETFRYDPPDYVKFLTENPRNAFEKIKQADFVIGNNGHVDIPKVINNMVITIGKGKYKLGIGGLHSMEKEVSYKQTDAVDIVDRDVASYYPNLMLNMNMSPPAFGDEFLNIYRDILNRRIEAKRSGNKTVADTLKIVLNGTFGKTSSMYSKLYSPDLMIRTTISGQLSLLMLIEMLELHGVEVISANTDGIVFLRHRSNIKKVEQIIAKWEKRCNLETEETEYAAYYAKDVNNYIAVKPDGSTKSKGLYAEPSLSKNTQNQICIEAVKAWLSKGVPVEDTVRSCKDIRKFASIRTVSGGAEKSGELLGKCVRWYYSTKEFGTINYVKNGNAVPRTECAKPLMALPDKLPDDIDYDWYIAECKEILLAIGATPRPQYEKVPRRNSKLFKELMDSGEIKEDYKQRIVWAHPEKHLLGAIQD